MIPHRTECPFTSCLIVYTKQTIHSNFNGTLLLLSTHNTVLYAPRSCPSLPPIAVIKHWQKLPWGKKGFTSHTYPRSVHHWRKPHRNSRSCFTGLLSLPFLTKTTCPGVALNQHGSLYQPPIKKMPHRCANTQCDRAIFSAGVPLPIGL